MAAQIALRSKGRISKRAQPSTRIKQKEEEKQIIETLEEVKEIPQGKTLVEKDWEQLQIMLSKGSANVRYSPKSIAMYGAIKSPTSQKIDNLVSSLPEAYIKQMRKMRQSYRSRISASAPISTQSFRKEVYVLPGGGIIGSAYTTTPTKTPTPTTTTKTFYEAFDIEDPRPSWLRDVEKQVVEASRQVAKETQRYKNLGYSPYKADILAKESIKRGGVSFTSEGAREVVGAYERKRPIRTLGRYFFGGEGISLEEQKRLQALKRYETETSYLKLIEGGDLPSVVRKASQDVGGLFIKGSEFIRTDILGGKPAPEKAKEKVGEIAGELALWGFFSPAFMTGAVAKQKETISQQLSKGKFEKLEKFMNKARKDLVGKKAGKEQVKYLKKLFDKNVDKKNPEAVKDFQKLVRELYNEGIFKGVPVKYVELNPTQEAFVQILGNVPQMKGVGVISGTVSQFGVQPIKEEFKVFEDVKVKEEFKVFQDVKVKEEVISKVLERQKQIPKVAFGLTTAQLSKQALKQKEALKSKQKLSQRQIFKQALLQPQIPKQKLDARLKQILRTPQKQIPKQPTKPIPPVIPETSLLKRLSRQADKGELFEAFAFKFGKEVRVAKGTKREVSGILETFLKRELSASGYLTKEGKKIKAEETGLLRSIEFRKSKVSPFLVVEKKAKRLRIGGTGKEIQFFRGKSKKSLFGM